MISQSIHQKLEELLSARVGDIQVGPVGGGCINETYRIQADDRQLFCKINSATKFPHLFERESEGLKLIGKQDVINVPLVIGCFETEGQQILLLEWITETERTGSFWKKLGEQLATLHQTSNEYFGWGKDNFIGSLPQSNQFTGKWTDFFIHQRLQPLIDRSVPGQLLSAKHQGQFERLYKRLPSLFNEHQKPSLLHGDLWSGNFMCGEKSEPVLIDPAVYFGHPSMDLGMTTLFGGFHSVFYEAYQYHTVLPFNYKEQWAVCNLYPLLVHLNLFGRSYLPRIENILQYFC